MREMQFRRLYDRQLVELANRRRPSAIVTRLLDDLPAVQSPLELAFVRRVVRRHGLPAPELQAKLCGFCVDFHWPDARLVVEADGKNHDQPLMRQADATRDAILEAAGFIVLRFRWADVHRHDQRTAARIRRALDESHPDAG